MEKVTKIETKCLGKSGLRTSCLGIGTSGLSGLHGKMDEEEAKSAVVCALNNGVNFIDTAPYYNNRRAEILLGEILTKFNRSQFHVCTKVGRYMDPEAQTESFDYSADTTNLSVRKSLQCLRISSLDLVLIHDIEFAPSLQYLQNETIPALVNLKREGLIKAIGISGYSTRHLRRVVESCLNDIDVIMSYFRCNVYDSALCQDLPFYKENHVGVINASPLGIGLLTNKGNMPEWNPASPDVKAASRRANEFCQNNGIDLSRLSLRYSVDMPGVDMTLWSTRSIQHMLENIANASKPLTLREVDLVKKLQTDIFSSVLDSHWEEHLNQYKAFWPL